MIATEQRPVLRSRIFRVGVVRRPAEARWLLLIVSQALLWWPMWLGNSGLLWAEAFGLTAVLAAGCWGWWRSGHGAPILLATPAAFAAGQWALDLTTVREATAFEGVRWLALSGLSAMITAEFSDSAERRRFRAMLLGVGWLMVLWGFVEGGLAGGDFGALRNPNHFAVLCELVLPLAWIHCRDNGSWWIAVLPVVAALSAGSRAGTILILFECVALWGLTERRWNWQKSAALIGLTLCGTSGVWWWLRTAEEPFLYRDLIWQSSVQLWREHPWLGHGLGTFVWVYPAQALFDTGEIVHHAHNDWLEWGVEGGIGLALFPALLGVLVGVRVRAAPWAVGALVVLVHAFVDYPLQNYSLRMLWGVLVTLALQERVTRGGEGVPAKELHSTPA